MTVSYSDPGYMGGITVTHALCDYAGSNMEQTGILRQTDPVTAASVTDGLSNTIMVGDKRLNTDGLGTAMPDDNEGYTCGFDEDVIRDTEIPPLPDLTGPTTTGLQLFGSSHRVVNFVFGDGAVHSIAYSIDPQVFSDLGTKNDGDAIPADSY
jgi:hypothetical protein